MNELEKLQKEVESLKNSNAVKSDLISISAHQLRTSLSALKWIFKMFLDKDLGVLAPEQEGFLKKASESNDRMIALVNDMLTLSHTEETALAFKLAPTDLVKLFEQTLFEFSGESHKKQIELVFLKPEHHTRNVNCDPEMIRVVFQNLTENAIKYSEAGDKVVISIKETDSTIDISVHDNGIGISAEEQKNIFGKFFRAENAKKKDVIGSGLGLFTVKKIVERHNGKIWFESTKDSGTTFFVSLPINK